MSKLDQTTWVITLSNTGKKNDSPSLGDPNNIDDILPDPYKTADCHIFVANGNTVRLPILADDPDNCPAIFVAVDGVEVTPIIANDGGEYDADYWTVSAEENQKIHAIFDWNNFSARQDWFSDILQFGLNSETGKRNQLYSGHHAFWNMSANPAIISNLDTSNLTSMELMFWYARAFNQDISGWDTSNVTSMNYMFYYASVFNQDLSQWCVSLIPNVPTEFDKYTDAWTDPRPVWGTCP